MSGHGASTSERSLPGGCPSEADLRRFDRLTLEPLELERLGAHIATCPHCASLLESETGDEARLIASLLTPGDHLADESQYYQAQRSLLALHEPVAADEIEAAELTSAYGIWSPAPEAPARIGPYEILDEIGRGGMGIVYRARHANLKRDAAVKILPPPLTARPAAVQRFYREMETIGQIHDPHIVHAYDAGEWEGIHFLAMEFVDGLDVAQIRGAIGRLSTEDACEIIGQAARGLETARRHHMVHRDVKPSNLMVTRSGQVKILDLGLAAIRADGGLSAGHEPPVGTVDYMAPEQWQCDPAIDIRADIYSLGCTLYTLLAGKPPFADAPHDGISKMQAHLTAAPPSLKRHRPDVADDLCPLVALLLSKNPDDRPRRPLEVAAALEPFRRGSNLAALVAKALPKGAETQVGAGFTTTWAAGGPPRPMGSRRRTKYRWVAVAAACLVAAGLLAIFLRDTESPAPQELAETGTELAPTPVPEGQSGDVSPLLNLAGHADFVSAVAISADGGEILTASHDRTLRLWDAASGQSRREFLGHADEVWDVAFRPGTRQAASASKDGTVRLWDLDTGSELHRFEAHEPEAAAVTFSRDGKRMLTAGMDHLVRLWDVDARELEKTLTGHVRWVRDVQFLPDERYAVTCDNATMGVLWDLETGRMRQFYVGHNAVVSSIRPSADGKYLASSSWDEMIRIWELDRAHRLQVLHRNMRPVRQVAFVGDTYFLLSASEDHKARLWNPFSAHILAVFSGHEEMVLDVACHVESAIVVTGSADRTAKIWPLPALDDPPRPEQLPAVPDLMQEAAAQGISVERPLRQWPASASMLRAIAAPLGGDRVATGGDDGSVRIWSVPEGELLTELTGPADGVLSLAYSHRGDRLAASSKDGNVYLWDTSANEPPRVLAAHEGWVTSIAFRPDDAELISVGFDGTVCSWSLPSAALNKQIIVSDSWLHDVDFWSGGEKPLAVCFGMADNPLAADLTDGAVVGQFGAKPFGHVLACGEISPDGKTLAAGGWRATVQFLNVDSQELSEIRAHYGTIHDLQWEPDSRALVTASLDGTLRLWDAAARREMRRFVGPTDGLRGFAILRENALIAAVSDSGEVVLFRYEPAGDELTAGAVD